MFEEDLGSTFILVLIVATVTSLFFGIWIGSEGMGV